MDPLDTDYDPAVTDEEWLRHSEMMDQAIASLGVSSSLMDSMSTQPTTSSSVSFDEKPKSIKLDENCNIEVLGETLTAHQFKLMIQIFKREHPEIMI